MTKKQLPKGVMRREATRELVCDVRFKQAGVKGKFHATQIESLEEGAIFYDIVKLYERRSVPGGGKTRVLELNYPDLSPHIRLCELPEGFDIKGTHKEQVQKLILEQARLTARGLKQYRETRDRHNVESRQSALNNQILTPALNTLPVAAGDDRMKISEMHASSSHGVQTSPMSLACPYNDDRVQAIIQDFRQKSRDLLESCRTQYLSRVAEREELERMLAGINEAVGYISLPATSPRENFYACVEVINRLIKELFRELEKLEQAYKSEQSKCWELRKALQEHNLKSIDERLNEFQAEEAAFHVIRSISEQLEESPRDVLRNPWVPLFLSPQSNEAKNSHESRSFMEDGNFVEMDMDFDGMLTLATSLIDQKPLGKPQSDQTNETSAIYYQFFYNLLQ